MQAELGIGDWLQAAGFAGGATVGSPQSQVINVGGGGQSRTSGFTEWFSEHPAWIFWSETSQASKERPHVLFQLPGHRLVLDAYHVLPRMLDSASPASSVFAT